MAKMYGVSIPKKNAWGTPGQLTAIIKKQPNTSEMKQSAEMALSPEQKTEISGTNKCSFS